jgi:murein DD-endopeptidase MepM/ murein hydrolase activator NlpD
MLSVMIQATALFVSVRVSYGRESRPDQFTAVAKRLVEAINASDYEAITREFNPQMQAGFPLEKAKAFFQGLASKMGKIQRIEAPRLMLPDQALFLTHFERGILDMKVILDEQGRVSGLGFLPVEPRPAPKDQEEAKGSETKWRLPFRGRWLVDWGGDTRELNAHHDVPNQVFAFDFLGVGPDGKTVTGEGRRNEDHYAFGREVLATADGIVTDVIEGVRDNMPGSLNPYSALGNAVFIEHRRGEVSVFAHLKMGSTRVRVGDRVKAGQVVGSCGNSGNSSKPHLHYHLQNTPVIQEGKSMKVYFQSLLVVRDGKTELRERYSPVRGEIVSPE